MAGYERSTHLTRAAFATALDQIPALRDALLHGMARRLHELDAKV